MKLYSNEIIAFVYTCYGSSEPSETFQTFFKKEVQNFRPLVMLYTEGEESFPEMIFLIDLKPSS